MRVENGFIFSTNEGSPFFFSCVWKRKNEVKDEDDLLQEIGECCYCYSKIKVFHLWLFVLFLDLSFLAALELSAAAS